MKADNPYVMRTIRHELCSRGFDCQRLRVFDGSSETGAIVTSVAIRGHVGLLDRYTRLYMQKWLQGGPSCRRLERELTRVLKKTQHKRFGVNVKQKSLLMLRNPAWMLTTLQIYFEPLLFGQHVLRCAICEILVDRKVQRVLRLILETATLRRKVQGDASQCQNNDNRRSRESKERKTLVIDGSWRSRGRKCHEVRRYKQK